MAKSRVTVDASPGPSAAARYLKTIRLPRVVPLNAFTLNELIAEALKLPHLSHKTKDAMKQHIGEQLRERRNAGELEWEQVGREIYYWPKDDQA